MKTDPAQSRNPEEDDLEAVRRALHWYLKRVLRSEHSIESVASRTILVLLERRAQGFRPDRAVSSARLVVLREAMRRNVRRRKLVFSSPDLDPESPDPHEAAMVQEWVLDGNALRSPLSANDVRSVDPAKKRIRIIARVAVVDARRRVA